ERREAAQAWQRHFAAWQSTAHGPSPAQLDLADDALLAEMYNTGQTTCDQALLGLDRARNLLPRGQRFMEAAGALDLSGVETFVEKQLYDLQEQGRQLDIQVRDALATLEPLELRFQRWSAALSHCSALRADPRD